MFSYFAWIVAFLPKPYRRIFHVSGSAALISGVLELLISLVLFIYRYLVFGSHQLSVPSNVLMGVAEKGGETAVMGSGIFLLLEYLIQPLTLLLVYCMLEGLTRALAALVSDEVVPTLPIQMVAWTQATLISWYKELSAGPRVADEVIRLQLNDAALRIASCRPKADWNHLTTIFHEGELFEMAGEEQGTAPRKFVYLLRKKPEGKIVRGIHHYNPDEVLQKKT